MSPGPLILSRKIFLLLTLTLLLMEKGFSQSTFPGYNSAGQIKLVKLSGTAYQRGHQHGKQLKMEIAAILFKWKNTIRQDMKRDADSVITEFLATTDFKPAILQWTPDLMEEVKGIAEG